MNLSETTQDIIQSNPTRFVNGNDVKRSDDLMNDKEALKLLAKDIRLDLELDGVTEEDAEGVDANYFKAAKEIETFCAA